MLFIRLLSLCLFVYVYGNGVSYNHPDQLKHYYYNPTWLTYDQQVEYCGNIGGHVIQIETHAESEWIERHIVTQASFMLGAKALPEDSNTTTWFDGNPITWLNWNINQPQRGADYCDQIFVFRPNDQLRSRRLKWYTQQKRSNGACDWKAHVLCEIPSGYRVLSERMINRTELLANQLSLMRQDLQKTNEVENLRAEMDNLRHELKDELKELSDSNLVERDQLTSEIKILKTELNQTKTEVADHVQQSKQLYREHQELISELGREKNLTDSLRDKILELRTRMYLMNKLS